ncbi:hypothetical protein ACG93T_06910 [Acinetobacter beijerinckii]|uniref:hypothetical protein n=1 Tax=Acinetobacter beijerinckii TaxID=262668 RepID=UPI003AF7A134
MSLTPLKVTLLSIVSSFTFSACSTYQAKSASSPQVLEQVKNIEATPSTKDNKAQLIKQSNNCLIEFTGYFDGGQAVEHWIFNQHGLISANSITQQYKDNKAEAETSTAFDTQDAVVQVNFKKLQSNFKLNNLAKCIEST